MAFAVGKGRFGPIRLGPGGACLPRHDRAKGVGAELHFCRAKRRDVVLAKERVLAARNFAARVQRLPRNPDQKVTMLMTAALPAGLHAAAVTPYADTLITTLRIDVLHALFPMKGFPRCAELALTLIWPGHRIDPVQAIPYDILRTFAHKVRARADLRASIERTWSARRSLAAAAHDGPLARVKDACAAIGWKWIAPFRFETRDGRDLDLLKARDGDAWALPFDRWLHEVRQALREREWRAAARRRRGVAGIERGIDVRATMALYSLGGTTAEERGYIRSTLVAGSEWCTRAFHAEKAKTQSSARCPYCSTGEDETLDHLWWRCPAWNDIRGRHQLAVGLLHEDWPPCLRRCGVMPVHVPSLKRRAELAAHAGVSYAPPPPPPRKKKPPPRRGQAPPPPPASPAPSLPIPSTETLVEREGKQWVVVWTDGASANNQDDRFRRAGWGAWWCRGHRSNASRVLEGADASGQPANQTNNRAEARAVLDAGLPRATRDWSGHHYRFWWDGDAAEPATADGRIAWGVGVNAGVYNNVLRPAWREKRALVKRSLQSRAWMMQTAVEWLAAECRGVARSGALRGGDFVLGEHGAIRTVCALGAPTTYGPSGITRRPVFAGARRTEDAIRRAAGTQRTRAQALAARRAAGTSRGQKATWACGIFPEYDGIRRGFGAAGAAAAAAAPPAPPPPPPPPPTGAG
eukprot:gene582-8237_t